MIYLLNSDARQIPLADKSVQCVVTSPPYWGLRDYGTAKWEGGSAECDHKQTTARHDAGRVNINGFHGSAADDSDKGSINYRDICPRCGARRIDAQIGLESTPAAYVAHIVAVMRECWRVLKDDGVMWLNLGDSYTSGGRDSRNAGNGNLGQKQIQTGMSRADTPPGLKPKDLCGIPWRVAFALQDDGWYLRSDVIEKVELYCPCGCGYVLEEKIWRYSQDREIIWHKPNPMPESVTDRPTKAHEYVFLLTKRERYYYDAEAIKEPLKEDTIYRAMTNKHVKNGVKVDATRNDKESIDYFAPISGRNRRSVWTVATSPYSGAHFATFPPALIEPMILAGTSARGECPYCGKAWVRVVEHETGDTEANQRPKRTGGMHSETSTLSLSGNGSKEWAKRGSKSNTIGWRPQCDCRDLAVCTGDHSHDCLLCNNTGFVPMIPEPIPQTVLDPFAGSGTTGAVAVKHGRRAVLLDLNTKYINLQFERTSNIQINMQM